MKSPDFGAVLKEFDVLNFSGSSEQEVKRSVVSLFGGLTIGYGVVAASGALIYALALHHSDLALIVQQTSSIVITGTSFATLALTLAHGICARK